MTGTVKFYKPDKNYGFITGEDGKDYFVHQKACIDTIRQGDSVTFSPTAQKEGKICAMNVEVDYNKK